MTTIKYDSDYFIKTYPNIGENKKLREPQILGYYQAYEHFVIKQNESHGIIILPTGVGKTGLMGLLPYGISEGRVLIITPQLVIKDAVLDSLDPSHYENFWLKRNVIEQTEDLPVVIEYEGDKTPNDVLLSANIVILNIHKLQRRLSSSLLNNVASDFFDMIIIDEAHHSIAQTWVDTVNYFNKSKVIKLTGTPFRSDDKPIEGEVIYKYELSAAMAKKYIKTLENFTYVPEELYLTIDKDEETEYTVEEILEMGIKDENWVSRSVAFSKECSEKVIDESLKKLNKKLEGDNSVPHKIIAVACSINHANQIKELYEKKGYKTTIIHSDLDEPEKEKALKDIENNRVQVVVNVAMLGEGYDHPYLSIGAIFRPYRSKLPYAQFVGRVLRIIPEEETTTADDNIASIISHKNLYLEELWEYYKEKIEEKNTIIYLDDLGDFELDDHDSEDSKKQIDKSIGNAREDGTGELIGDPYLDTELIQKRKEEIKEKQEKISKLKELFNLNDKEAERLYYQGNSTKSKIKRPDLYFNNKKQDIDQQIRYEIVPELISKYNIEKENDDLKGSRLFSRRNSWITSNIDNNAGMLAAYFNNELKIKIGKSRNNWELSDIEIAHDTLPMIKEYVISVLEQFYN